MLAALIVWLLLSAVFVVAGAGILAVCGLAGNLRRGDALLLSFWAGLLLSASLLLSVSLAFPLGGPAGKATLLAPAIGALLFRPARSRLSNNVGGASLAAIGLGLGVMTFVSIDMTQPIRLWDTGLYHYPAIRWLTEAGSVPGLAFIHQRLGLGSTWFALPAVLDGVPLQGRAAALPNGLVFAVSILHFLLALSRIAGGAATRPDWFCIGAYPLALHASWNGRLHNSASTDPVVCALVIVVAWSMMVLRTGSTAERTLLLVLGAGAAATKMNAIPLAIACLPFLSFLFRGARSRPALLTAALLFGAVVLPAPLSRLATTGCPLFPGSWFCQDQPWSVGAAVAKEFSFFHLHFNRWEGFPKTESRSQGSRWDMIWADPAEVTFPADASFWDLRWLPTFWQGIPSTGKLALLVSALSFVFMLVPRAFRQARADPLPAVISVVGVVYCFALAPDVRFAMGYLAILPGIALAAWAGRWRHPLPPAAPRWLPGLALLAALGAVDGAKLVMRFREGALAPAAMLLLPPRIGDNGFDAVRCTPARHNDLTLCRPLTEQCWAAPLPCSAYPLFPEVRLRRPKLGIRGGFVRQPAR